MATQALEVFAEQTGITATSDQFVIEPGAQVSAVAEKTAEGFATLQFSVDPAAAIAADGAVWVDAASGAQSDTFGDVSLGPVTGVRLNVASGTWNLKVLQVRDADKQA